MGNILPYLREDERQLFQETMTTLQSVWNAEIGSTLYEFREREVGIRSTQIGALVILLIKLGVIKPNE